MIKDLLSLTDNKITWIKQCKIPWINLSWELGKALDIWGEILVKPFSWQKRQNVISDVNNLPIMSYYQIYNWILHSFPLVKACLCHFYSTISVSCYWYLARQLLQKYSRNYFILLTLPDRKKSLIQSSLADSFNTTSLRKNWSGLLYQFFNVYFTYKFKNQSVFW